MDWFFENLGKIVTFVVFIIYILSSLKGAGGAEEEQDPEAAERARKVQEEIRRKIMERQRSPQERQEQRREELRRERQEEEAEEWEEEPVYRRRPEPVQEEAWRPQTPPPVHRPSSAKTVDFEAIEGEFAEQRRRVEAQLEEARRYQELAVREVREKLPKAALGAIRVERRAKAPRLRALVEQGLSDRQSMQAAVVLKEILDKPVGLR